MILLRLSFLSGARNCWDDVEETEGLDLKMIM